MNVPSKEELRSFGITFGVLVAIVFGALLPWLIGYDWPIWPWCIAIGCVAWALFAPGSLATPQRMWLALGERISRITAPIMMAVVYFLVVTPTALIRRTLHRDASFKGFDAGLPSYREPPDAAPPDLEAPY